MSTAYLRLNPPARPQYRSPRRAKPSGAIVLHTAESITDINPPDTGAENVARFISTRTDAAGSYHDIVDSDSIVHLVDYEDEAFHDGTGGNRWSLSISWAMRASDWGRLPDEWVESALINGAVAAKTQSDWVKDQRGFDIPAKRITATAYRSNQRGFTTHGELDPKRRTDPGAGFPWERFLKFYRHLQEGIVMDRKDAELHVLWAYNRLLKRQPDPAGRDHWIAALEGGMDVQAFRWEFMASALEELQNRLSARPAAAGPVDVDQLAAAVAAKLTVTPR